MVLTPSFLFMAALASTVLGASSFARKMGKTLLVGTTIDEASKNIVSSLLATDLWSRMTGGSSEGIYIAKNKPNIYLWMQDESLLRLDNVHRTFSDTTGLDHSSFSEVIFLSKHAAASGIPSLTVHPIGVPWLKQSDCERYGGIGGRASPPSNRIGSLYRSLLKETVARQLDDTFQVTLEATHHGPFCELPTCFVEIGSCVKTWDNPFRELLDCSAR